MPQRAILDHEFIDWTKSSFQLLENGLNGSARLPFHGVRKAAVAQFAKLGLPTTRDEEWKYTNVLPIFKNQFALANQEPVVAKNAIDAFGFEGLRDKMIVLVNGRFSKELSTLAIDDSTVKVGSLSDAIARGEKAVQEHLSRYADFNSEPFVALNTAFTLDGTFIHIPDDISMPHPIHLCHIVVAEDAAAAIASPRTLMVVGKNSQVHLIESYHTLEESAHLTNAVTEVVLEQGATVEHIKMQLESKSAYHIAASTVHQAEKSCFSSVNIDLGGAIVRNNLNVVLNGENAESHLYGFFRTTGSQLIDNHTFIDHAVPNCESNELYKGILDDSSKGVFNGKVLVRQDAQKTNAFQESKCLLLTDDAVMYAKPQLEIFADDVKCSHGATVGQLDEDAQFYLRSRGIGEEKANSILRHAFASDIFERIEVAEVRDMLESLVFEHFND
ncbi:MAG: Fe-S cluster assembly protein SufD [Deferribacteres bacterium]|nr:Fe-S cluster assembly protein SufD [candidate division KSB1 bacterium]MCB9511983.1 Fe-S cluster assembly protein SufD [Deferribacteres bacterium]